MNSKDEIMEMPAEVDFSDSIPNPYIEGAPSRYHEHRRREHRLFQGGSRPHGRAVPAHHQHVSHRVSRTGKASCILLAHRLVSDAG